MRHIENIQIGAGPYRLQATFIDKHEIVESFSDYLAMCARYWKLMADSQCTHVEVV